MDAVTSALQTLQSSDVALERYRAALRLGWMGDEQIAEALSHVMCHHADWGTRQGAAWAAGEAQLTGCVPALQAVLTRPDEDEQVRYVAALALVRVNHAGMLQVHAASSHNAVRRAADAALRAVPYLIK